MGTFDRRFGTGLNQLQNAISTARVKTVAKENAVAFLDLAVADQTFERLVIPIISFIGLPSQFFEEGIGVLQFFPFGHGRSGRGFVNDQKVLKTGSQHLAKHIACLRIEEYLVLSKLTVQRVGAIGLRAELILITARQRNIENFLSTDAQRETEKWGRHPTLLFFSKSIARSE